MVKHEARPETYRAGDYEDGEGEDTHVPIVDEKRGQTTQLKLSEIVPDSVQHCVEGARAASHEGSPPPTVVLTAELEIVYED